MTRKNVLTLFVLPLLVALLCAGPALADEPELTGQALIGTAFTYQGHLAQGGSPATGPHDFDFRLYNSATGTGQVGPVVARNDVLVQEGAFTVSLDFGNVFNGQALWLQVGVRPGASTGAYTFLAPRTYLTAAPYAMGLLWGTAMSGGTSTGFGLTLSGNVPWSNGLLKATNSGNGPTIWGVNTGGGSGIRGYGFGASVGVYGEGETKPGVIGRSTADTGVSGISVDSFGVTAHSDNTHSLYIDSAGQDGIHVASAGNDGIRVASAGWSGVYVASAGYDALRVQTAGQDGLRIFEGVGRHYIYAGSNADPDFIVTNTGAAYADGGFNGAADFAEMIAVDETLDQYQPGDVLVISLESDRRVDLSEEAYSTLVAGVYSENPGFIGSSHSMDEPDDEIPMAVVGIVPVKVSTENGPIHRGDLLVTSSTPGHAMRADDPKPGTILGKALGELESGTGVIEVLVTLQ